MKGARGVLRVCAALVLLPAAALAQDLPAPVPAPSATADRVDAPAGSLAQAIITVDQESLFRDSAWGKRAIAALGDKTRQVAAENDRLFAQLSSEEAALTELRKTLPPEEFRTRATAFDERVQKMRREREDAALEIQELSDAERATFFRAATPVIGAVMRERGALVVLDQRTVLFSVNAIDVTRTVIMRLDTEIGDGAGVVRLPEPAPKQAPDAPADRAPEDAARDGVQAPGAPPMAPPAVDAPAAPAEGTGN